MSKATKTTTADVLIFAGQVTQGLMNAKSAPLREGWVDWAVHIVTVMGRLIDQYDRELEHRYDDTRRAERAEFLLAVAAACAEQEIGDLVHDVGQVMDSANGEMNERLRLEDKVEGLETKLFEAVRAVYRRGGQEWARLNYPGWIDRLDAEMGEALR